jgi:hypothetical protein
MMKLPGRAWPHRIVRHVRIGLRYTGSIVEPGRCDRLTARLAVRRAWLSLAHRN